MFWFLAVPMGMLRHLAKSPLVKTWVDRHTSVCLFAVVRIPCLMGSIPGTPVKIKSGQGRIWFLLAVPMGIEPMLPEWESDVLTARRWDQIACIFYRLYFIFQQFCWLTLFPTVIDIPRHQDSFWKNTHCIYLQTVNLPSFYFLAMCVRIFV